MFMKSAVNLFSKMKLEILSNLLKEVTGLTLKANKISSASLQGDEAPNELSTMTKPSIIFSTSTGILLQIQKIKRELAGDFVSSPSASERTDRNVKPVRFGIRY